MSILAHLPTPGELEQLDQARYEAEAPPECPEPMEWEEEE